MKLSKNELKDLVKESYGELLLEQIEINEVRQLAYLGDYCIRLGEVISERTATMRALTTHALKEDKEFRKYIKDTTITKLNESAKNKGIKWWLKHGDVPPWVMSGAAGTGKLLKWPSIVTAGWYGVPKVGEWMVDKGKDAVQYIFKTGKDIVTDYGPMVAVGGLGALGAMALKNKGDLKKTKAQAMRNLKYQTGKSAKKGKKNVKAAGKWAVAKGKEGIKLSKKEWEKYKAWKKKKEAQAAAAGESGEQLEIPFESYQRINKMTLDEMAPLAAMGQKALDIINGTEHYQNIPIRENQEMSSTESDIVIVTEIMDSTHKVFSEGLGEERLEEWSPLVGAGGGALLGYILGQGAQGDIGKSMATKYTFEPNVPATADTKAAWDPEAFELEPGDENLSDTDKFIKYGTPKGGDLEKRLATVQKIKDFTKPGNMAMYGAAAGALLSKDDDDEDDDAARKKGWEDKPIDEANELEERIYGGPSMFGLPVPPQSIMAGYTKVKDIVTGKKTILGKDKKKKKTEEAFELNDITKSLNEIRKDMVNKKFTVKEVRKWMNHLEENKYKKTYINDAKRVTWFVNNNLSEDYDTMPASIRRKREGVNYGRERYLAKEFLKQNNSKALEEKRAKPAGYSPHPLRVADKVLNPNMMNPNQPDVTDVVKAVKNYKDPYKAVNKAQGTKWYYGEGNLNEEDYESKYHLRGKDTDHSRQVAGEFGSYGKNLYPDYEFQPGTTVSDTLRHDGGSTITHRLFNPDNKNVHTMVKKNVLRGDKGDATIQFKDTDYSDLSNLDTKNLYSDTNLNLYNKYKDSGELALNNLRNRGATVHTDKFGRFDWTPPEDFTPMDFKDIDFTSVGFKNPFTAESKKSKNKKVIKESKYSDSRQLQLAGIKSENN
tara:strand:- start:3127 stop:5784 length:2658 start_codon:yes stop_codon:yes gene_type:complete